MPPPYGRRPWRRPPWWPEDEPWPPRGRRPIGPPLFVMARLGCLPLLTVTVLVVLAMSHPVQAISVVMTLVSVACVALIVRWLLVVGKRGFEGMLERAVDARRRTFLADVSHEFRTPLAIIRGQAEAIADGVYAGDAEHLAPIIEAVRTLEVLSEDLRTLALAEAGSLALAREPVSLAALAHDVVAGLQAQAEGAGVTLTAAGDEAVQAEVDPARMRGVIGNLVANALRHTPDRGSVRVAVDRSQADAELTVTDTGEGIPPDLLPHVFERFVRSPGSGGSGLGLAIARDIVTAHGGTIAIDSQPGSGTTVRVRLPAVPER